MTRSMTNRELDTYGVTLTRLGNVDINLDDDGDEELARREWERRVGH